MESIQLIFLLDLCYQYRTPMIQMTIETKIHLAGYPVDNWYSGVEVTNDKGGASLSSILRRIPCRHTPRSHAATIVVSAVQPCTFCRKPSNIDSSQITALWSRTPAS